MSKNRSASKSDASRYPTDLPESLCGPAERLALAEALRMAVEDWSGRWEREEDTITELADRAGARVNELTWSIRGFDEAHARVTEVEQLVSEMFKLVQRHLEAAYDGGASARPYLRATGEHLARLYVEAKQLQKIPAVGHNERLPDQPAASAKENGRWFREAAVRMLAEESPAQHRRRLMAVLPSNYDKGPEAARSAILIEARRVFEQATDVLAQTRRNPAEAELAQAQLRVFDERSAAAVSANERAIKSAAEREERLRALGWRILVQVRFEVDRSGSVPELRRLQPVWKELARSLMAIEELSGRLLRDGPRPKEARIFEANLDGRGGHRRTVAVAKGDGGFLREELNKALQIREILRSSPEELPG